MPDIDALFKRMHKDKKSLYIAGKLNHDNTARVDRWIKEGKVPATHKFQVMELLKSEGYLG
jgi:hypothetical protein